MIDLSIDENEFKKLCLEEIRKRAKEVESQTMLMDIKELCKMLSLSRPTVEKLFIYNPNFPAFRVGKKWMFNRKEVEEYIKKWSSDVRKNGGIVDCD